LQNWPKNGFWSVCDKTLKASKLRNKLLIRTIWALLKILLKKDAMEKALKGITIQGNPIVNSSAVPDVIQKDKKKNSK